MEELKYIVELGDDASLIAWVWVLKDFILVPVIIAGMGYVFFRIVRFLEEHE
jgi:hypothetical protein